MPDNKKDEGDDAVTGELSLEELLEKLELFEPYTTDELVDRYGTEKNRIRQLLDELNRQNKVRKKKPKSNPTIWIREPPVNKCSDCGREFEIKYLHPVFSAVQFCPRCGKQL